MPMTQEARLSFSWHALMAVICIVGAREVPIGTGTITAYSYIVTSNRIVVHQGHATVVPASQHEQTWHVEFLLNSTPYGYDLCTANILPEFRTSDPI